MPHRTRTRRQFSDPLTKATEFELVEQFFGSDGDQISGLRAQVQAAESDRDVAAETAIARIEQVTSSDGLNDSWWDKFAAVLQALARITEKIAMITGILALLFSWVPALGPALLAVSALAGLISAVANLALAAGGKQSWTQAITSVLFAALGCVGLGGMRGTLGAVKGLSEGRVWVSVEIQCGWVSWWVRCVLYRSFDRFGVSWGRVV